MDNVIKMRPSKTHWILLGLNIGCGLILGLAAMILQQNPGTTQPDLSAGYSIRAIQGGLSNLELDTAIPQSSGKFQMYSVVSIDHIQEGNEAKAFTINKAIASASEAPALAEKGLEIYGGLPKDAQLDIVVPNYKYKYNLTTNK
jgi:hypothetical protein